MGRMVRKPLVAGNWKMNGTRSSVADLLTGIKQQATRVPEVELVVFPPFVFIDQTAQLLADSPIGWGVQTLSEYENGAYTGEISTEMVRILGCGYAIIGHSERRQYFAETDEAVANKVTQAITRGITPILCVGETLEQRESDQTEAIISGQIDVVFSGLEKLDGLVVAYEPVWAIGTGKAATPDQAQEVHAMIRAKVAGFDQSAAEGMRILYGGSMKPGNAASLFAMPDIDGGLVGGASLKAEDFIDIALAAGN